MPAGVRIWVTLPKKESWVAAVGIPHSKCSPERPTRLDDDASGSGAFFEAGEPGVSGGAWRRMEFVVGVWKADLSRMVASFVISNEVQTKGDAHEEFVKGDGKTAHQVKVRWAYVENDFSSTPGANAARWSPALPLTAADIELCVKRPRVFTASARVVLQVGPSPGPSQAARHHPDFFAAPPVPPHAPDTGGLEPPPGAADAAGVDFSKFKFPAAPQNPPAVTAPAPVLALVHCSGFHGAAAAALDGRTPAPAFQFDAVTNEDFVTAFVWGTSAGGQWCTPALTFKLSPNPGAAAFWYDSSRAQWWPRSSPSASPTENALTVEVSWSLTTTRPPPYLPMGAVRMVHGRFAPEGTGTSSLRHVPKFKITELETKQTTAAEASYWPYWGELLYTKKGAFELHRNRALEGKLKVPYGEGAGWLVPSAGDGARSPPDCEIYAQWNRPPKPDAAASQGPRSLSGGRQGAMGADSSSGRPCSINVLGIRARQLVSADGNPPQSVAAGVISKGDLHRLDAALPDERGVWQWLPSPPLVLRNVRDASETIAFTVLEDIDGVSLGTSYLNLTAAQIQEARSQNIRVSLSLLTPSELAQVVGHTHLGVGSPSQPASSLNYSVGEDPAFRTPGNTPASLPRPPKGTGGNLEATLRIVDQPPDPSFASQSAIALAGGLRSGRPRKERKPADSKKKVKARLLVTVAQVRAGALSAAGAFKVKVGTRQPETKDVRLGGSTVFDCVRLRELVTVKAGNGHIAFLIEPAVATSVPPRNETVFKTVHGEGWLPLQESPGPYFDHLLVSQELGEIYVRWSLEVVQPEYYELPTGRDFEHHLPFPELLRRVRNPAATSSTIRGTGPLRGSSSFPAAGAFTAGGALSKQQTSLLRSGGAQVKRHRGQGTADASQQTVFLKVKSIRCDDIDDPNAAIAVHAQFTESMGGNAGMPPSPPSRSLGLTSVKVIEVPLQTKVKLRGPVSAAVLLLSVSTRGMFGGGGELVPVGSVEIDLQRAALSEGGEANQPVDSSYGIMRYGVVVGTVAVKWSRELGRRGGGALAAQPPAAAEAAEASFGAAPHQRAARPARRSRSENRPTDRLPHLAAGSQPGADAGALFPRSPPQPRRRSERTSSAAPRRSPPPARVEVPNAPHEAAAARTSPRARSRGGTPRSATSPHGARSPPAARGFWPQGRPDARPWNDEEDNRRMASDALTAQARLAKTREDGSPQCGSAAGGGVRPHCSGCFQGSAAEDPASPARAMRRSQSLNYPPPHSAQLPQRFPPFPASPAGSAYDRHSQSGYAMRTLNHSQHASPLAPSQAAGLRSPSDGSLAAENRRLQAELSLILAENASLRRAQESHVSHINLLKADLQSSSLLLRRLLAHVPDEAPF
ncbi:hypothetical protein DIPPA_02913 [Diplonema papillatum]|nr:hypothetical protein DIPPA_02913 [Diplonema papillatum]